MQKIVEELKGIIPFKSTTDVGDVVLIAAKEPQMLMYAHVSDIERDSSRRDEWWHVKMEILSIPLQKITWTLRTEQMTGKEIFTMGGEDRFLAAVEFSSDSTSSQASSTKQTKKDKNFGLKRIK